jgi:hypothetical protein
MDNQDRGAADRREHERRQAERRQLQRRGESAANLSPEEYNRRIDATLHFVEQSSDLVQTTYSCLRVVEELNRLYTQHQKPLFEEPLHLVNFPELEPAVRDLRRRVENLETIIQIQLTAICDTAQRHGAERRGLVAGERRATKGNGNRRHTDRRQSPQGEPPQDNDGQAA